MKENNFLRKFILFVKVFCILFLFGVILPEIISMVLEYIKIEYPHRNSMLVNSSDLPRTKSFINTFFQYIYMYFFD